MTSNNPTVTIVGAGLAGCEAAWQLAKRGLPGAALMEMKPVKFSPAHKARRLCGAGLLQFPEGRAADQRLGSAEGRDARSWIR